MKIYGISVSLALGHSMFIWIYFSSVMSYFEEDCESRGSNLEAWVSSSIIKIQAITKNNQSNHLFFALVYVLLRDLRLRLSEKLLTVDWA